MVRNETERAPPQELFFRINRATGSERASKMADVARAAVAACGLTGLVIPCRYPDALAVARACVPASLHFTEEQWKHSPEMAMAAMFANAPRDEDELHLICNKKDPKTGLGGQKWRIDSEVLAQDEPDWLPVAAEARAKLRAHAAANAADILKRFGGPDAKLMDDEELAEYETKTPKAAKSDATAVSSDEDEGAKENAGAARNKPAPPKAAKKAAKAPGKKRERAAAESDDEDEEEEEEAPAPKRKYVKKAKAEKEEAKAHKAPKQEKFFYKAVSAIVDLGLACSNPLQLLLINLGLDAPGAEGTELRSATFNFAVSSGGSAALNSVPVQAERLLNALRLKAQAKGIAVPEDLVPVPEAEEEAAAEPEVEPEAEAEAA